MIPQPTLFKLFDQMLTEAPFAFKDEEHKNRKFKQFCDTFSGHNQKLLTEAVDYAATHLIRTQREFPTNAQIINVYERIETDHKREEHFRKQFEPKPQGERGSLKPVWDAVAEVKTKLPDLPHGFADNNWHDAPIGETDAEYERRARKHKWDTTAVNYKKINSMAEVIMQWWDEKYVKPAIVDHMAKLKEDRYNMPRLNMVVTECSVNAKGRPLCYYCFNQLYHPYTQDKGKVIHSEDWECTVCHVIFTA